jgi:hypothetical protein
VESRKSDNYYQVKATIFGALIEAIEATFKVYRARASCAVPLHRQGAGLLPRYKAPAADSIIDGPVEIAVETCSPLGEFPERPGAARHFTVCKLVGDAD